MQPARGILLTASAAAVLLGAGCQALSGIWDMGFADEPTASAAGAGGADGRGL
jgi:hypothetical protein